MKKSPVLLALMIGIGMSSSPLPLKAECPKSFDAKELRTFIHNLGKAELSRDGSRYAFTYGVDTWYIEPIPYKLFSNYHTPSHSMIAVDALDFQKEEIEGSKDRCYYQATYSHVYYSPPDKNISDFRITKFIKNPKM